MLVSWLCDNIRWHRKDFLCVLCCQNSVPELPPTFIDSVTKILGKQNNLTGAIDVHNTTVYNEITEKQISELTYRFFGEKGKEMNIGMQNFTNFLESNNIKYSVQDENCIRISYQLENLPQLAAVFFFSEECHDVSIHVFSIVKVASNKLIQAYKLCSELNAKWRWVKFYVDEDNELTAETDAVIEPNTAGRECGELLLRCVDIVKDSYPNIMALVWGQETDDSNSILAPQKK